MARRGAHRFPPRRLAALTDAQLRWVRPLWFLVLVAAIVLDIAGTVFILREAYERDPVFARYALSFEYDDESAVLVHGMLGNAAAPPVEEGSRILAIDGKPVPRGTPSWDLADLLAAHPDGKPVALTIEGPGGERSVYPIVPDARHAIEDPGAAAIPRDTRMIVRFAISLLTCLALISCAVLLFMRRPRDPVALLFSFSFLIFAATIDPPLLMLLGTGFGRFYDIYSTLGWLCLVIGMATFPDGIFSPRWVRWILVAAPLAAIPLTFTSLPVVAGMIIAFVLPLLLLACQAIKYRRLPVGGIERQQIKWAAFGLATGLVLLTIACLVLALGPTPVPPIPALIILTLFSTGFLAMALGLLISLIRFRLWEADQVISRSAVAAAVTLAVGIVWTLSTDLVKAGVELTLGEQNLGVATVASAVLAAGIFAPTQAVAQRWAKSKFDGDSDRIRNLISRLAVWRTSETPEEIGMRSLSALAAAVHCSSAAIVLDTPHGRSVVASRDIEDGENLAGAADEKFVLNVPLEDEDGPIGQLLLGPRSDFNRYNSSQTAGIHKVAEPLAEAFRAAVKRAQHSDSVQRLLGSVEERLARLEGGGGGLSPA